MRRLSDAEAAEKSGYPEYFLGFVSGCNTLVGKRARTARFHCRVCGVIFDTCRWDAKDFSCLCYDCLCAYRSQYMKKHRGSK